MVDIIVSGLLLAMCVFSVFVIVATVIELWRTTPPQWEDEMDGM